MLISYHWLKKFVPNLKASPKEVADRITLSLVEVELVTKRGEDTILEIENKGITNRPDCFSQLGIAREAAAYFGLKLNEPLKNLIQKKLKAHKNLTLRVSIEAKDLCGRYNALVLNNIKVSPSPKWLRVGLENSGIRSINNVVDITNYVMLELGQPLHAFDYEKIGGKKIIVRRAKDGEEIITLDGINRSLTSQVLVIADEQKPIGVAGIMGGANSEVTSQTKSIVLESANFEPINNRLSSKFLKLRSEASTRFEKDLNNDLTYPALIRAVGLLEQLTGAKVASKVFDLKTKPLDREKIVSVSPVWLNKFLGVSLRTEEIISILERLTLKVKENKKAIKVTIPPFRKDLNLEADIAEEVARIYGYDKIPVTLPKGEMRIGEISPSIFWRQKIKETLAGFGMTEIHTYSLVGDELLEKVGFNPKTHLKLKNPLTEERKYLRRSLIPSMLEAVVKNQKYENLKLFETAKIFLDGEKGIEEKEILVAAVAGDQCFYKLKGILETLLEILGINKSEFVSVEQIHGPWAKGETTQILVKNEFAGVLGEIHSQILENIGIKNKVVIFNLDFDTLVKNATTFKTYTSLPKYPPIIEDLAFVVPRQSYVGPILQLIKVQSGIIQSVKLLDSFNQTRTFRITFQHPQRNLTDKEVEEIRKKIIKKVETQFNACLKA